MKIIKLFLATIILSLCTLTFAVIPEEAMQQILLDQENREKVTVTEHEEARYITFNLVNKKGEKGTLVFILRQRFSAPTYEVINEWHIDTLTTIPTEPEITPDNLTALFTGGNINGFVFPEFQETLNQPAAAVVVEEQVDEPPPTSTSRTAVDERQKLSEHLAILLTTTLEEKYRVNTATNEIRFTLIIRNNSSNEEIILFFEFKDGILSLLNPGADIDNILNVNTEQGRINFFNLITYKNLGSTHNLLAITDGHGIEPISSNSSASCGAFPPSPQPMLQQGPTDLESTYGPHNLFTVTQSYDFGGCRKIKILLRNQAYSEIHTVTLTLLGKEWVVLEENDDPNQVLANVNGTLNHLNLMTLLEGENINGYTLVPPNTHMPIPHNPHNTQLNAAPSNPPPHHANHIQTPPPAAAHNPIATAPVPYAAVPLPDPAAHQNNDTDGNQEQNQTSTTDDGWFAGVLAELNSWM